MYQTLTSATPTSPTSHASTARRRYDRAVAIRAVMEEGSADYAWNPQVSPEEVRELEANGIGSILTSFESRIHFLQLNFTDPQRGSSPAFPNPIFEDKRVRQAFAYAINRERIAEEVYGVLGQPEDDYLLTPDYYKSPEILYTYDKARARSFAGSSRMGRYQRRRYPREGRNDAAGGLSCSREPAVSRNPADCCR
ncbi:MAG: hypothetical protein HC893_08280 [Chloroflexaceae bacterium]|nr:hypothetical protein [Chloroflexaceae bacterium]